jgi:endonuclease/exonuclease/phosphatase family metal-dependent hydrolase
MISGSCMGQELSIVSWNLKKFGKSRDSIEMLAIAKELKDIDLVCIQEVVAKDPGGAKAVARLADVLNRTGSKWDYRVTDPTGDKSPNKRERYAFLWKTSKVKLDSRVELIKELDNAVCREPAVAVFKYEGELINIINYHACTHNSSYPERAEIKAISDWLSMASEGNYIWCGDMNLVITDHAFESAFNLGYESVLHGEKTSLKKTCVDGNYLSRAEDNVLYKLTSLKYSDYSVLDFISKGDCEEVSWKRHSYSDHLGVVVRVE